MILLLIANTSRATIEQINRFIDTNAPKEDIIMVDKIGVYYQPFKVDYLEGFGINNKTKMLVTVLSSTAQNVSVGDSFAVVYGRGLLQKTWVAPKQKHEEYNNNSFKILYLGVMSTLLIVVSIAFFRLAIKQNISKKTKYGHTR